jgi:hypothetical protein
VKWSSDNALPLAPDKSIFMILRRRRTVKSTDTLLVDGVVVPATTETRDLGIQLRDDLECSSHVLEVTKKAFRISNLILRVLKTKKLELFKKAYCTLVLPILEYASVVWCPIYAKDVNKIETVQRRFTKRAQRKCGLSYQQYTDRLIRWNIKTLEYRRMQTDLITVYKILYGFMDVNREQFFRVSMSETELKIFPHPLASGSRNNTQLNTLANRTYRVWNGLPLETKNSVTVAAFKRRLLKIDLGCKFNSKITV